MILLDTNVIVDLFGPGDNAEGRWSRATYRSFSDNETFACNLVVVAELAAQAPSRTWLIAELDVFRIEVLDLLIDGAFVAGRAHDAYRRRGGAREAILADFLIAGHAEALGASLMTRDRRLAGYFPDLTLITPETHP